MSHDRFRYGLIAAAYALAIFLFFVLPPFASSGPRLRTWPWFRTWSWPWFWTSFALPTAALITVLVFKSLTKRDPFRSNYGRFRSTFELFLDLAVVLAVSIQALIVGEILSLRGIVGPWIRYVPTTVVGLILVVFGNVLPRLRPNSAVGVRTRWALADEVVWMKTHRAGGYLLVLFGLLLVVWTFVDFRGIWWVLGPGTILTVLGLPVLSYVIWKRRHPRSSAMARGGPEGKETVT